MKFSLKKPEQQVNFAHSLIKIRKRYLQDALRATVSEMDLQVIDNELHETVSKHSLNALASFGLRGESFFPVASILKRNPNLLGYYRLLLGYSRKEFYQSGTSIGMFMSMEDKNMLNKEQESQINELCALLTTAAEYMLSKLSDDMISNSFFDQLTLLTLGPQLRGGANVQRGTASILQVFEIIFGIVRNSISKHDSHEMEIINSSGRKVFIQFASDPDIVIKEEIAPDIYKYLIAIEVKGGQDYSNIHNRIGEAEKSHQKAKKKGYVEFWTVINVENTDMDMAHRESPTTNRFYKISDLQNASSNEYNDFRMRIISSVGIK